jgi:hypothetical protein
MSERDHPIPEIISFIRKSDGRGLCFGRWPSAILETYLRWHHQNGSLVIVEQEGDLVALAVGTKMSEDDIDKHWVAWNESGDAMYLSDIVATTKEGVAACVDEFSHRCKNWRELKLYACRHGRKVLFKPKMFERILKRWK